MKQLFSSRLCKLLVLILSLLLVIGLGGCFGNEATSEETLICTVSVDNLSVHKKSNADSKVLSQLPLDLEVEILEQKTGKETDWGRIDKMTLADGTKIKAGWIDLQHVRFPGDPVPGETEPTPGTEPAPSTEIPSAPVAATMGTVTAGKLTIRKGPDSKYESDGAYYNGDRIEILETQAIDGTTWGRTNLGWIGMGYVRMDGAPADDTVNTNIVSNGNTEVLGYGVIDLGELNVRLGPGTDYDKVNTVNLGVRYAYYQLSTTSGSWARIEDGWVSTEYFYIEGTTAEDAMSGTVATEELNIRTGPDTSFQSTGVYVQGEPVDVLAQVGSWGYTEKGWVFMTYVEPVEPIYATGICKITRGLNIRKEPNANSEIVGSYSEGDGVTILEVQDNWGKTIQGWINLKYVTYESVG